ncbi:MAG: tetratricopeptide repeat protein [Oligoflexales bacterium]|nr:tetratricopeptide repeat protein [Oligoflexales bacterium]
MKKNLKKMNVILPGIFLFIFGCSTINDFFSKDSSDEEKIDSSSGKKSSITTKETISNYENELKNLELRLSKLWVRVDELEDMTLQQKERIFILEKGLLTGLIPEEWNNKNQKEKKAKKDEKSDMGKKPDSQKSDEEKTPPKKEPPENISKEDEEAYGRRLAEAHSLFTSEQYGKAIASYERIGSDYPTKTTKGNHLYWIGICWFHLKDFDLSKKYLERFISEQKENPLIPKAMLYLAKGEVKAGYSEKAVKLLEAIIKQFPNDETSMMAKKEIKDIEKTL